MHESDFYGTCLQLLSSGSLLYGFCDDGSVLISSGTFLMVDTNTYILDVVTINL